MKIENFTKEQNELVAMAFNECGVDCVLTFKGEGRYVTTLLSNAENSSGDLAGSRDVGLCQMNWQFHFDFIFDLSKSEWLSKLSQKELDKLEHSYKWTNRSTYQRMRKEFYRMYEAKQFSPQFLNPKTQMQRCIGIWHDAKKRGILTTTFYAYRNLLVPEKKRNALREFTLTYK